MNSSGPSLTPFISEVRHNSVASPIDQLYLPQQGSLSSQDLCAFYRSPVITKALIRSTLFSCKATYFYSPLTNTPISSLSPVTCTITCTCTLQSPTQSWGSASSPSSKSCSKNRKPWSRKHIPQKTKRRCRGQESLSKRGTIERAIKTYGSDSKGTQQVRDSKR